MAWLVAGVGTMALITLGLSSDLFGRGQPGPERIQAEPGQVAVIDGDTLRLSGQVVRLAGIEAPGRGDKCSGDVDCGGTATTVLAGMVRDRRVECDLSGHDSMGRPYGACQANGTSLNRAIVAAGWARAQPRDAGLVDVEQTARQQRTGLWAAPVSH